MLTSQTTFANRRAGNLDDRLEILAADLIDLHAEGDASRQRLIEMGWPRAFLDEHEAAAREKANARFVRNINEDPNPTTDQIHNTMVEIIGSMFPSTQFLVAELQARGIPVGAIDRYLRKAKARAAIAFIHQGVH